jgi:hypothetical protein
MASRFPALLDYGSGLPPGPALVAPPAGLPAVLPYRPGFPVPQGYHAESRPSSGLVITGGLTFGVAYVTALGIAFSEKFENGAGWLAVPLIGPWGAISKRSYKCPATAMDVAAARRCFNDAYDEATTIAILAGDGVVQTFGVALFIAGLANQTHELVRNEVKPVKVTAAPRPGGGFDVAVRGRF